MKKKLICLLSGVFISAAVVTSTLIAYSYSKKSSNTNVVEEKHEEEKKEEEEKHEEEKKPEEDTPTKPDDPEEDVPSETECSHEWSEFIINKDATCSSEGLKTRSCKKCLKTQSEVLPINENNHDYTEPIVTKRATCQEEGEAIHYCNHNKEHVLKEVIDKIPHVFSDKFEKVEPTYRKTGTKAHYKCLICDTYFDLDMNTKINKEDLIIPKLDSTNIDLFESKIDYLDSLSDDLKEYHGDYIEILYEEYNSLSKEERDVIDTEKFKESGISYKAKLDEIKEKYLTNFIDLRRVYNSKNNSIGILNKNGTSLNTELIKDEYGYTNGYKAKENYNGNLNVYIKADNCYKDYLKNGIYMYIYSPINTEIKIINNSNKSVVNTYSLYKDKLNKIELDSNTTEKLFADDNNNIEILMENINLIYNDEFKFSSIYSKCYSAASFLNEINNDCLNCYFSKDRINKYLYFFNNSSTEFKNNSNGIVAYKVLNEANNHMSKYSDYMSSSSLKFYHSYTYKTVSSATDEDLGKCYRFLSPSTSSYLTIKLNYMDPSLTSNKGIEFYIKGDLSNYSSLSIASEYYSRKFNFTTSLVKPNILKVLIDKGTVSSYISEYETSNLETNISISGVKAGNYLISNFYFLDC